MAIIDVVGVGPVELPDGMSKAEMAEALDKLPRGKVTVEGAPSMPNQPNAFASNEGGAAFGRPNVHGQLNVQSQPRPTESFLAGATKSLVTDPVMGVAQFVPGTEKMVQRFQDQADVYKNAAPEAFTGGQIAGSILPAAKVGGAIGSIPSLERLGGSISQALPKAGPIINKIGQGLGYGAAGSMFSPDTAPTDQSYGETVGNRLSKLLMDTSIGGAIPAVANTAKPILKGAGRLGSEVLGMTTGTSGEAIREAYKAGKNGVTEFVDNMRGRAPVSDILEAAQSAMAQMKQNRRDAFEKGFESTKKNQVFLDFAPIEEKFNQITKGLTHEGVGGVSASKVGKKTMADVNEIKALIKEWKSKPEIHTAEGLDALKRRIDDLWTNDMSNEAKSVLTQTRGVVKNTIAKQDKNYAKTMRDYEDALKTEREIEAALKIGGNASADTAIRRLQSLGRNNANTNYGYRQELADTIKNETGLDLMPALAGQSLNTMMPRGIQKLVTSGNLGLSLSNPLAALALPMQSPRAMGEMLYKMGQSRTLLGKIPSENMTDEQKKLAQLLLQQSILKAKEE